ncbi:MAG: putative aminohydrolase SsnA [Spirochaetaceae bacterium]
MLIIENATAVQLAPAAVFERCDVVCDNGAIVDVGPWAGKRATDRGAASVERVDAAGRVVMPGLVCAHTHFYSGLARGITVPLGPMPDFPAILEKLWWRLDRSLNAEAIRASAAINVLEAVAAGTTTIVDHHASAGHVRGSLDIIAEELRRVGLRGLLCYETSDRDGPALRDEALAENEAFAAVAAAEAKTAAEAGRPAPMLSAAIGAHALFTLGDETLARLGALCDSTKLGIHIHIGEDPVDEATCRREYGCALTDRLTAHGLLSEKSILAHGIHLSGEDRKAINAAGAFLVHNTRSNMNNGVGYNGHLGEFESWALGTDGITGDMFEEASVAWFKHRDAGGALDIAEVVGGLSGGHRMASRHFGAPVGTLDVGAVADLVILDYRSPTPLVPENLAGHIAFAMKSADVDTVVIDGRIVYADRRFPFDVAGVYAKAREVAADLWERMTE